jgi:hypothetical protein
MEIAILDCGSSEAPKIGKETKRNKKIKAVRRQSFFKHKKNGP